MVRISGVDIPEEKKIEIALTKIFGVGRRNVVSILMKATVDGRKKTKDLNSEEISRLQKAIEQVGPTEGDLRKKVEGNISRLKRIGSYRGKRHSANLPVRGQRTRTNARTKRGKRVTIGALKKEVFAKIEQGKKEEKTKENK